MSPQNTNNLSIKKLVVDLGCIVYWISLENDDKGAIQNRKAAECFILYNHTGGNMDFLIKPQFLKRLGFFISGGEVEGI